MDLIFMSIIAFTAAIIASMGIGGGSILVIYLSVFAGIAQKTAQGINLLFFIPVAIIALILHTKSHLVHWKITLFSVLPGIGGAFLGFYLCGFFEQSVLKKMFAIFLLIIGIKELLPARSKR